jgi:DNA-binding transcriptional MerR regulator
MLAAQPRTKSPEAFRNISEVSDDLDVPQHVLRFWEGRFTQIRPVKRAGGRRYYRPEDVDLLRGIRTLLYSDGYTIKGVQKILRDRGMRHVVEVGRTEAVVKPAKARAVKPGAEIAELRAGVALVEAPHEPETVDEPTHARAQIARLERAHAEAFAEPAEPVVPEEAAGLRDSSALEDAAELEAPMALEEHPAADTFAEPGPEVQKEGGLGTGQRASLEALLAELLTLKTRLIVARG